MFPRPDNNWDSSTLDVRVVTSGPTDVSEPKSKQEVIEPISVKLPFDHRAGPQDDYATPIPAAFIGVISSRRKPGAMWFDTGCRRCVSGPDDHRRMHKVLERFGLKAIKKDCDERFKFGNGKIAEATCSYEYPVFISNQFVATINIACVDVPCPPLFSLQMAKLWKCCTDHEKKEIYVKVFDHHITYEDTPFVHILEIETQDAATDPLIPKGMRI